MFNVNMMNTMTENDNLFGVVHGVYIGIVTDNKDPENLGRVKVKVPVFDDENEHDWARVATMMAGSKRGSMFIPEIGDEVLVAFLMGDITQPVVVGSLWNKKAPPPGPDRDNNIRKITTKSGHEIIFDDKPGDEKVTVKSKKGHVLDISDSKNTITVKESTGKSSMTLTGGVSHSIELKTGPTTIKIDDKGDVTLESMKGMKLKSTQITIEATASLDVKAGASLNINSNGLLNIKGSIVKIN